MLKKLLPLILSAYSFIRLFIFSAPAVQAQAVSSGVAVAVTIAGDSIQNGDIICADQEVFVPCSVAYDKAIFGVVTDNAAASIESPDLENARLVLSSGKTQVRVSSVNGNISVGDFITSSETPGVGQRADKNGYILGAALEAYESTDATQVGTISVSLNIRPQLNLTSAGDNLIQTLREGLAAPFLDPISALRYFSAALIVIAAFVLGFVYFGRVAKAGVDAIGRNPLAGARIEATVVFHIILTIGIAAIGVGIAYLILTL